MYISYKDIFKSAWKITVSNRVLWIFGLLASFISLENVSEIIMTQYNSLNNAGDLYLQLKNLANLQSGIIDKSLTNLSLASQSLGSYISFILFGALLILVIWVAFTSQIFMIKSAAALYRGKKLLPLNTFQASDGHFWPVFTINLLTKLVLYAGYIALSLPLLYMLLMNNINGIFAANLFFFLVFTALAICLTFISAYATNFIVLKNYHIFEALDAAWHLFKKNILLSIEVSLILFFLKLISLIIIVCLGLLFILPISLILVMTWSVKDIIGIVMGLTLLILALLIIYIFVTAIFSAFYLTAWTITFIKLTEETIMGKIFEYIKTIPGQVEALTKRLNISINKKAAKKITKKLISQTEFGARDLAKNLAEKYVEYKPVAIKQSKIVSKKIQAAYEQYEPKLAKQANEMIAQLSKDAKKITAAKRKKTGSKTKSKKKIAKK